MPRMYDQSDQSDRPIPVLPADQGEDAPTPTPPPAKPGGKSAAPLPPPPPTPPTRQEVETYIRTGHVDLSLPAPAPTVGPDPAKNEWGATAVGFPLWLWTPSQPTRSTSVSIDGFTLTITATPGATTFRMGDGHSVTCRRSTPYRAGIKPATPSPTCGYRYQDKGRFTITATQQWKVTYAVAGVSGSLSMDRSASTHIKVIELESVIVR